MIRDAFVLLERSLRIDARSGSAHLARLGLMGTIYLALWYTLVTKPQFGAPGLHFFQGIAYLDATFMTLLGIGFFSTSITEEKEEDTLGLMLMAGISPLGILVGKSGGRLWQALLLLAVQCPFMLLAVTIGGVTTGQIWATTTALLAYMVFLAGLGLLCSTLARNSRAAGSMMVIGLTAYFLIPSIARGILMMIARSVLNGTQSQHQNESWRFILRILAEVCVFLRMGDILTTGFGESLWSVQVLSNLTFGVLCAGLSWGLFGYATRNPSGETSSRGLVSRQRSFVWLSAGRPGWNPFVWKDFHFVAGGIGMIIVRSVFYVGLCIALLSLGAFGLAPSTPGGLVPICLILMSLAVAIDAAIVLARSMHDEIRGQTLASLMLLPRSSIGIVYAKFLGSLSGWLPGPLILLTVTLMTDVGRLDFTRNLRNEGGGWCLFMLFAMIPHFAPIAALYVRWGAVPLAIGMALGLYFMIVSSLRLIGPTLSMDTFFQSATIIMVALCVACHIGVLLRVQSLGAR